MEKMNNLEDCLKYGKTRKVEINKIRASSLLKSSHQAVETAKKMILEINSAKSVFRELYEGLREYCEAIGYLRGYKFLDHISISFFLRDIIKNLSAYKRFDRYRELRNRVNYYGDDIDLETVKEAKEDIPKLIKELEIHVKI